MNKNTLEEVFAMLTPSTLKTVRSDLSKFQQDVLKDNNEAISSGNTGSAAMLAGKAAAVADALSAVDKIIDEEASLHKPDEEAKKPASAKSAQPASQPQQMRTS